MSARDSPFQTSTLFNSYAPLNQYRPVVRLYVLHTANRSHPSNSQTWQPSFCIVRNAGKQRTTWKWLYDYFGLKKRKKQRKMLMRSEGCMRLVKITNKQKNTHGQTRIKTNASFCICADVCLLGSEEFSVVPHKLITNLSQDNGYNSIIQISLYLFVEFINISRIIVTLFVFFFKWHDQ